ncbi:MAG: metallophosphoesterase family protein [Candidatus Omnitrophota bacterium]
MRYVVFSDVHSNLQAFEAALETIQHSEIDRFVFVGDIVGYGANPRECISLLRGLNSLCVAGNHDWVVADRLEIEYFNAAAKEAALWTKEHIAAADRVFLSGMTLTAEENEFCIVHGTLDCPEEFDYMLDGTRAAKTFALFKKKICFVGHSHWPGVFVEEKDKMSYEEPVKLSLEADWRYIVNVGSIGQPRNGDPRACFCIYDDQAGALEFKRLDYDIALAQKKILAAGLPRSLAERLSLGR